MKRRHFNHLPPHVRRDAERAGVVRRPVEARQVHPPLARNIVRAADNEELTTSQGSQVIVAAARALCHHEATRRHVWRLDLRRSDDVLRSGSWWYDVQDPRRVAHVPREQDPQIVQPEE
jgi:hypothetical protein